MAKIFQSTLMNSGGAYLAGFSLDIISLYYHRGYSQISGLPGEVFHLVSSELPLQLHLFKEGIIYRHAVTGLRPHWKKEDAAATC